LSAKTVKAGYFLLASFAKSKSDWCTQTSPFSFLATKASAFSKFSLNQVAQACD